METERASIAADPALLMSRRACYRFLALALADPHTGTWSELADPESRKLVSQAAEILRGETSAAAKVLAAGERPLADLDAAQVFARLPKTSHALNELYEATFGLLGGSKCPPYETEYVPSKFTFQRSNTLADVAGFYRAFGLQTSSSNPDRPDHVALQFEFLAQLIRLQWQAGQSFDPLDSWHVRVCDEAGRRFLNEHVVWWAPAFARVLALQDPGGFYEAVAQFLAAFITAERALAGLKAPRQAAEPSIIENADACSGCALAIE